MRRWTVPLVAATLVSLVVLGFFQAARADFCASGGPPGCLGDCCEPPGGGAPPGGFPPVVGDPVDISGGNTLFSARDVELPTAAGPLIFRRTYTSKALSNEFLVNVGDGNNPPPFPFGSSSSWTTSRWNHNWRADVSYSYPYAYVHDNRGFSDFFYCPSTPGFCTAGNYASRSRLELTSTGFVYYQDGAGKLILNKLWVDSLFKIYFLGEVWSPSQRLATVSYAQPTDPSCQVAPVGSDLGLPYISSVRADDGAGLSFAYTPISSRGRTECVVSSVSILPSGTDAGSAAPAVSFAYSSNGYDYSKLISATLVGAGGGGTDLLETYSFSGVSQSAIQVQRSSNVLFAHQDTSSSGWVNLVLQPSGRMAWNFYPDPVVGMAHPRTATFLDSQPGDGTPGPVDAGVRVRTYDAVPTAYGAQMASYLDTCSPGAACSPGWVQYVYYPNSGSIHQDMQAAGDKRGGWDVLLREPGQVPELSELRWKLHGAADADGGQALESTSYSYLYGAHGEQQLQSEFRDSVLGPGGSKTETRRSYMTRQPTG